MRLRGTSLLLLALLLLVGCGCAIPPYVPPQPTPTPTPPPDPLPIPSQLTRASFSGVTAGAIFNLGELPQPDATVTVGALTIRSWTLGEARPEGGNVRWEVHTVTASGLVKASFAW